ncbi:MAG: RNA polymerase factor sigma-54 [Candidatus Cloacimonetes bacterium]|nr:RNA polymerase factor sigma-54 [Candidatus Cloacimonadota bacterium]
MRSGVKQHSTQKVNQDQALKPQMLHSLKMLAMNAQELEIVLKQEINDNPLLELDDDWDDETEKNEKTQDSEDSQDKKDDINEIDSSDIDKNVLDPFEGMSEIDEELQQTINEAKELSEVLDSWNEYHSEFSVSSNSGADDEEDQQFEKYAQAEENFKLEYINQFDKLGLQEHELFFIYDLVDNSNAYGFLPRVVDKDNGIDEEFDIYALATDYKISFQRADELHKIVLQAYPRGISARSINECLFYQLETYEQNDELLSGIILDDFEDLLHRKYAQLAKKYDAKEDDIYECRDRIARLDPKPGLRITKGIPQYIVPDIIVTRVGEDFEVLINDFNIPKLSLSRKYNDILRDLRYDKDAVNYVKDKINSAKFMIKTVFMRNRTLERVMKAIIKHQKNFFYNNAPLEPLTYSMIAIELDVNESTVSRVVKSKYADTHFGIFCLKDFFCSNAGKDKNFDAVSKQNVLLQVKQLIDNEDSSAPISDQDIVDILKERGMSLSRRVISKYRDELKIPNSRDRKI